MNTFLLSLSIATSVFLYIWFIVYIANSNNNDNNNNKNSNEIEFNIRALMLQRTALLKTLKFMTSIENYEKCAEINSNIQAIDKAISILRQSQ